MTAVEMATDDLMRDAQGTPLLMRTILMLVFQVMGTTIQKTATVEVMKVLKTRVL